MSKVGQEDLKRGIGANVGDTMGGHYVLLVCGAPMRGDMNETSHGRCNLYEQLVTRLQADRFREANCVFLFVVGVLVKVVVRVQ